MKNFYIGFLLIAFTGLSHMTCAQLSDQQRIERNFQNQIEAWNNGDIDSYCQAYVRSDSTKIISRQGVVLGFKNILKLYKEYWKPDNMGTLTFSDINLQRLSDQYFFVTGYFKVQMSEDKVHDGYFSVVMKKIDGEWLIFTDHSS